MNKHLLERQNKAISRIVGKRFGRLVALKFVERRKFGTKGDTALYYSCLCDCGKLTTVVGYSLTSKNTSSCGCLASERRIESTKIHGWCANKDERGGRSRPEYAAWIQMKDRIKRASTHPKYKSYIGITICKRWLHSFENFINDLGSKPSPNHSLDRKKVHLGYSPSNCRWATREMQDNNRSNTFWVNYKGKKKSL